VIEPYIAQGVHCVTKEGEGGKKKSISALPARLEKRLLIIRNLQSEKTIVDEQEDFYLSKGKFLQIRKKIPAD
jgi:hypothetical protein